MTKLFIDLKQRRKRRKRRKRKRRRRKRRRRWRWRRILRMSALPSSAGRSSCRKCPVMSVPNRWSSTILRAGNLHIISLICISFPCWLLSLILIQSYQSGKCCIVCFDSLVSGLSSLLVPCVAQTGNERLICISFASHLHAICRRHSFQFNSFKLFRENTNSDVSSLLIFQSWASSARILHLICISFASHLHSISIRPHTDRHTHTQTIRKFPK